MTRPRLLLTLVVGLLVLGAWLQLRRGDNTPEPLPLPPAPAGADSLPTATAPMSGTITPAVIAREPARTTPDSPGPAITKSTGLRGIVNEVDGDGLPDLHVELVDGDDTALLTTTTDDEGRFAFDRHEPRAKAIITRPAPHGEPRVRHGLPAGRPGGRPGSVEIVLWRPPTSSITGVVLDAAGAPVAGAVVITDRPYVSMGSRSWHVLDGPSSSMSIHAKTAADGRFELPFVFRGRHRLRADHDGRFGSVSADAEDTNVVIYLGTHTGGTVSLSGQLKDSVTGVPIVDARLSASLVRRSEERSSKVTVARVVTDDQGRYEVQGLEVGLYELSAMPDFYAPLAAERELKDGSHVVDLELTPARQIRVRVVLPDGRLVQGAKVRVQDLTDTRVQFVGERKLLDDTVRTDANGFATLRRLPAVQLTLIAARTDFAAAGRASVDLRYESPEEVTIELPSAAARFARQHFFKLLDADGKPAAVDGTAVASSYVGGTLLSRVEGRWRSGKFYLGNEEQYDFSTPMLAVGAPAGVCRVEIAVSGYQVETLMLEADAVSPTTVTLRR